MTSLQLTLCVVKILLFVLPVTSGSATTSPFATTGPASPESSASPTNVELEEKDDLPIEEQLDNDDQNTTAVYEELLNATDATTVFTTLTSLLGDTTTDSPTTSTSQATTRDNSKRARAKDADSRSEDHDKIFKYDEKTLRQWGLICALILCVIGFLVLCSGRCRGCNCRRRQKRKYNITGI